MWLHQHHCCDLSSFIINIVPGHCPDFLFAVKEFSTTDRSEPEVLLFWFLWPYAVYEPPHDKTNNVVVVVHPAKTQISLGIRPVWSESSPCAQWVAKEPSFLHADSEDSDRWRTATLLVLSRVGSYKVFALNLVAMPCLCTLECWLPCLG